MSARLTTRALVLAALLAGSGSCARGDRAAREPAHAADRSGGGDTLPPRPADSLRDSQPGALRTVASTRVLGRTGPGGEPFDVALRTPPGGSTHFRRFGTRTLDITLRTRAPDLGQYPCTACHLGRRITMAASRVPDAHQDIASVHPQETGAACATCHAADDVELLALESGERATLDHAYRLCAQCHVAQVDAWAAGAHGKRLDGWRGRRVVMGCADCHEPHRPALEARTPFRAPRLHRPGSETP